MKIIAYKTICHRGSVDKEANELIRDGWQPFGAPYYSELYYYQAMVRYEDFKDRNMEIYKHNS